MYMPTRRPRWTQLKPQPQRRTPATARPRNGTTTPARFAACTPTEVRSAVLARAEDRDAAFEMAIELFVDTGGFLDLSQVQESIWRRRKRVKPSTRHGPSGPVG